MKGSGYAMHPDVERILFTPEQISLRIGELAERINADYKDKNPILISVLKGSFIFMADLLRAITVPCSIDFMAVSSYGSKSFSTGAVEIVKDLSCDIEERHVIIVEDILDSGTTLNYLMTLLSARRPASMCICALLDKPERRRMPAEAVYRGFVIPDAFVIGYGLDYAEQYRNLPYIGILSPRVYENELAI